MNTESKKYKRGITWGAFDPLHHGHIRLIQRAKEQCRELIVGLSTADYILAHKHRVERFPYDERERSLMSLKEIRMVIPQDDTLFNKRKAVYMFRPDVIFVGDNWSKSTFSGEKLGVPVIYLPHTPGIDSTELAEQK